MPVSWFPFNQTNNELRTPGSSSSTVTDIPDFDINAEIDASAVGAGSTTDLITPTSGARARLGFIIIRVSAATVIEVIETNSSNVEQNKVAEIEFSGAGTYDIPLPVKGWICAAVNNKIRVQSSAAVTLTAEARYDE